MILLIVLLIGLVLFIGWLIVESFNDVPKNMRKDGKRENKRFDKKN